MRWFKAQAEKGTEAGVELLAPEVAAAMVEEMRSNGASTVVPALLLRAVEAAYRPASILVPRGTLQVGKDFLVTEMDRPARRVRVLEILQRTGAVEQATTGNVLE